METPGLCSFLLLAALGCANGPPPPATSPAGTLGRKLTADERLSLGRAELAQSRYAEAEKSLIAAAGVRSTAARAELALAELYVTTGRYEQASSASQKAAELDRALSLRRWSCRADAWMKSGRLSEAEAALAPFAARPDAPALRLLLGELLLETGRREQAEPVLLTIVEDYNEDRIAEDDGRGLARAARAAWLCATPATPTRCSTRPNARPPATRGRCSGEPSCSSKSTTRDTPKRC